MSSGFLTGKTTLIRCAQGASAMIAVAAIALASGSPVQAQGLPTVLNSGTSLLNQLMSGPANLPPTNLDSFVAQSGYNENIYGDESTGLPPLFGFTQASRINTGILGVNNAGLTTGHGSYMPDAWGADEFLAPPGEWSQSGSNNGNVNYNNAAAGLDAQAQADAATAATQAAQNANGVVNGFMGNSPGNNMTMPTGVPSNVNTTNLPGGTTGDNMAPLGM